MGDSSLTPYTSWADYAAAPQAPGIARQLHRRLRHALADHRRNHARRASAPPLPLSCSGSSHCPMAELSPRRRTASISCTAPAAWASSSRRRRVAHTCDDVTTTGLDAVDLWVGGLAEAIMPLRQHAGPRPSSFVFETQLENLQNGDRFYYLDRTAGTALRHRARERTRSPNW